MMDFFLILISTALVNNVIVGQVIGSDPALAFSRKLDVAIGLALTMLILLPLATVSVYLIDMLILMPFGLEFMQLLVFVVTLLILMQCLKIWGHFIHPKLAGRINIFLPLAGINTTVLGVLFLNEYSLYGQHFINGVFQSFAFGLGSGLGFGLTLLMLTAICVRLDAADVPQPFRGIPILLITLGLMSMAFLGFTGLAS